MARYQRNGTVPQLKQTVPPLPHPSWALSGQSHSERRLSPQEAKQMVERFWETLDA